jgi:hypothetical protein
MAPLQRRDSRRFNPICRQTRRSSRRARRRFARAVTRLSFCVSLTEKSMARIPVESEPAFGTLLTLLTGDTVTASIHWRLCKDLWASVPEFVGELNQSPAFWTLTFNAHREVALFQICLSGGCSRFATESLHTVTRGLFSGLFKIQATRLTMRTSMRFSIARRQSLYLFWQAPRARPCPLESPLAGLDSHPLQGCCCHSARHCPLFRRPQGVSRDPCLYG